jgi:hypothetical protein
MGAYPLPDQRDIDRQNDRRLLTPLLVMALILVGIALYYSYEGRLFGS